MVTTDHLIYAQCDAAGTFQERSVFLKPLSRIETDADGRLASVTGDLSIADIANLQNELNARETAGTAALLISGLTKSSVGLPHVDDTSDADKPVSTAQGIAIAVRALAAVSLAGYGITDGATLTQLSGKADKATTLAGYGITDSATLAEMSIAAATQVAALNLGSAATQDNAAFVLARSFGSAATSDSLDFATSNQGLLAASAVQPGATLSHYGITDAATQTELSNKADKATTLAGYGITDGSTMSSVAWDAVTDKPAFGSASTQDNAILVLSGNPALTDARPPTAHAHAWSDLTSGVPPTFPPTIGATSTTAVAGDDSRLTDSRTPSTATASQAEMEAGSETALRMVSPLLVKQAITALAPSGGGTFDAAALASVTHAATSKATPVDADEIPIVDSAASNTLKKLTWANLKATAKSYFDTLYLSVSGGTVGDLTVTGDLALTGANPLAVEDVHVLGDFISDGDTLIVQNMEVHGRLFYSPVREVVTLTSSGTWTVPANVNVLSSVLVVGGGGGGGRYGGGGGGAGGVVIATNLAVTPGDVLSVTIGAGGTGRITSAGVGGDGGSSVFGSLTPAVGGGGGGAYTVGNGRPGGSGGGGALGDFMTAGSPTSGQGYVGGAGGGGASGGGGGAGAAGVNGGAANQPAGAGGAGISNSITGVATYYAGGGGGSATSATVGAGGLGGGGAGSNDNADGVAGTANTGGGGGGANGVTSGNGGNGGSGVIIIQY